MTMTTNDVLIEVVVAALEDGVTNIDSTSEPRYAIRFDWRRQRYRVTHSLFVEEITADGFARVGPCASLMSLLIKRAFVDRARMAIERGERATC